MPEYDSHLDIATFISRVEDEVLAPRTAFKEEARNLAEEFAMMLKTYIQNNISGITGQSEAYLLRKIKEVGHAMPLVLTYQYVNSIKVFEDKEGTFDIYGENGDYPRFYINVYGYKTCKGFYVDVEDIWHDPSPMHKGTGGGMHEYLKEGKSQRKVDMKGYAHESLSAEQDALLKQNRLDIKKALKNARRTRNSGNKLNLIGMRQLKKILEYGQRDSSGNMLFTAHWGPMIDLFESRIGTAEERWRKAGQKFYKNRVSARTDISDKEL